MDTSAWLKHITNEIHDELVTYFGLETEEWAIERVRRVQAKLQLDRPLKEQLWTEILWMQEMTAFTMPGQFLYVTRELLQRLTTDDSAAFVIAHEIAHHRLGHLRFLTETAPLLRRVPVSAVLQRDA